MLTPCFFAKMRIGGTGYVREMAPPQIAHAPHFRIYDPEQLLGAGDVKYHLGFASDIQTPGGPVHMAMAFNPSHLEIVDPVVLGSARARQIRRKDDSHDEVMPILIHGDASFSGQGVIMETTMLLETYLKQLRMPTFLQNYRINEHFLIRHCLSNSL